MQRSVSTLAQAFATLLALVAVAMAATAAAAEADVQGGHDHALVSRFAGSRLTGYYHADWAQSTFPLSVESQRDDNNAFAKPDAVEGEVTRLVYLGPRGKSALEVFRNYEQALKAAGFVQKFHCELQCGLLVFHWRYGPVAEQFHWAEGHLQSARDPGRLWGYSDAISLDEGRLSYGTITRGDRVAHVLVYTSIAGYEEVEASSTVVEIAEPKAMQAGQVTINADALAKGLAAEGKIALYGVYFDTGKAVLKPGSDAQLKEMGQLLAAERALKVFIVGHTDNQGVFEDNLKLSLARAQAVRDALVMRYGVDGTRLTPYGVANTSPLASNAGEAGRARNRRVELVVR
jgi:outer membrane protein OmpA-like peptidoglycan-associated protein